ncbi:meprin A subunit beta-like [Nematolebias whitei]|uniref:meprin A subunit beta-like n=1 Tax=Nematolebias whitei TaxID=451745 RepID=UPI00189AD48C|nr:meprin A subunit beta-like [Nematolebias whitei]
MPELKMKSYIFLMISLVLPSAFSMTLVKPDIMDIGENKKNTDDLLLDDIHKAPNRKRSTTLGGDKLWPSPVPYTLDNGLEMNAKGIILRAFDQFRIKSCIDFKAKDSEDYYLSIQNLNWCWSYVGRELTNGQNLSIGVGCDYLAIVEHELLHALGFHHEQSRYDRDAYVKIVVENILKGHEANFERISSENSTTHGVPYDYWSVMHYDKDAFSNGNSSTIITTDPEYQNVIGQKLGMSFRDVQELNLLYNCNSTVAFMFYCGFSNGTMCEMNQRSQNGSLWEVVTQADGGPSSDHTTLPSGKRDSGQEEGYFIHASTASSKQGDSAQLETQKLHPKRECRVQCLHFYYYHSGNDSDELNIWIREFEDEQDSTGTLQLMGQITGPPTSHWKLHHVSLNSSKQFQVVFEVQKGAGDSGGGFSIDDINLSESECPHIILQIDEFETCLNSSNSGTRLYSPRQYSKDGYAYRVAVILYQTYVGTFVQLLSSDNDDQLKWPCLHKQMTFQLLDQNPNMQQQMSKQMSFTSNQNSLKLNDTILWDNPRKTARMVFYENSELVHGGMLFGYICLMTLEELHFRDFLKGGSAIFMFNFEDLTPLVNGSTLPCPKVRPMSITHSPTNHFEGLNSTW